MNPLILSSILLTSLIGCKGKSFCDQCVERCYNTSGIDNQPKSIGSVCAKLRSDNYSDMFAGVAKDIIDKFVQCTDEWKCFRIRKFVFHSDKCDCNAPHAKPSEIDNKNRRFFFPVKRNFVEDFDTQAADNDCVFESNSGIPAKEYCSLDQMRQTLPSSPEINCCVENTTASNVRWLVNECDYDDQHCQIIINRRSKVPDFDCVKSSGFLWK